MFSLRLFGTAMLIATGLFAQVTTDLTGKVSDSTGAGLAGVEVRLLNLKVQTTSTTGGNYSLKLTSIKDVSRQEVKQFKYHQGLLTFRQIEPKASVQISLLSVEGKTLRTLINSNLSSGTYSMGISRKGLSPQMYVLMIRINEKVQYLPVSLVEYSSEVLLTKVVDQDLQGLSKATAVIDTLSFRLLGYDIVKVPIESYTGINNATLKSGAWNGDTNAFWGRRGNQIGMPKNSMIYKFLNRTNGRFPDDSVFWEYNGVVKSIAEQDTFDMTGNGRIWFYLGKRKTGARYMDFIEHNTNTTWSGNTSRVDWYGFPIAIRLHTKNGFDKILGEHYSVFFMGRQNFFNRFKAEVPEKFKHLAEIDGDKWIVCPGTGEFKATGKYTDYYKAYVDSVWAKHSYTVGKPKNAEEIFRCSGTMGGDPQMCAALNRGTGMLTLVKTSNPPKVETGTWWDVKQFYTTEPANYYSDFMHRYAFEGKSYGFAYDDVHEQAAFVSGSPAHYLLVAIGF